MPDSTPQPCPTPLPVFLPLLAALCLILMGGYAAIYTVRASLAFFPTLNHLEPALTQVEPELVLAHRASTPPLARRVVLVIVDGLRLRESYGLPFLDSLRRRGVDASANAHYPTFSRPNHTAIVTGVPPLMSGVRTNQYSAEVRLDSLMARVRAAGMTSAFVADHSRSLPLLFARTHIRGGQPRASNEFADASYVTWPGGFELTAHRLLAHDHALVVLLPGDVDVAGHERGGDSPEYRAAARQVDALLARALADFDYGRDAVVITADHGHSDPGGHGGLEPEVVQVPLILAGAGVRPGAALADAQLIDVAPTVAALLGVPAPGHGVGRALLDALMLAPEDRDLRETTDATRILRNRTIVDDAKRQHEAWLSTVRSRRVPMVAGLLITAVLLILTSCRLGALHIDVRVLCIALPAFPLTYYALIAVFDQQFSPSSYPESNSLVDHLFRFGLMSTSAHVVASWLVVRDRVVLAKRLATACGLVTCGLLTALAPIGLVWSLAPAPFITVPPPWLMVLIPATYVACSCYAISMVVILSLEIVVFFARAVDPRMRPGLPG